MHANKPFQRTLLGAGCALALAGTAVPALAANWLMLQGTEPEGASARANVWGFIQMNYQDDLSDPNPSGQYVPPKLLGPDLDSQSGFNISRARLGVRGTGFPLDSHINYFLMAEFGNSCITHCAGDNTIAKMIDASVSLNYIPGARVRAGLFKTPGAEEGLQAIHVFDYINFTEAANGLLLERFPNAKYTANLPAQTEAQLQGGGSLNGFTSPVGGFRDVGVQVFDAFDVGKDWELSYAAMVGNGNGIEFKNSDGEYDKYLYLSAEKKYGGKGPKAEGLKFFGWGQWGSRQLDNTNDSVDNLKKFDRNRAGLGMKYMNKPFRFTAEYISADGMIFEGPDKPSFYFANAANTTGANNGADAKGNGWYVEGGWYIPNSKWELDLRYDTATFNEARNDEHQFDKWTLGVQYHFNPMTRLTVNYEMRDFKCTATSAQCTNANVNLNGVGDRVGVQLTAIF
ncbi:MAG: porin [Gallionellaceae bacterium]|nr:porin [Gallionellaceae bacterium]MDD5366156.1 porin [Gallionellaceae bacterium]